MSDIDISDAEHVDTGKPLSPKGLGDDFDISDLEDDVRTPRTTVATHGISGATGVDMAGAAKDGDRNASDSDLTDIDDLSDLDENFLRDIEDDDARPEIAIDEDALRKIGTHRRKPGTGEKRTKTVSRREAGSNKRRATGSPPRRKVNADEGTRSQRPEIILTEEQQRLKDLDDRITEATKQRTNRKKKDSDIDIEKAQDEAIENLKNRMTLAAKADAADKDAGKPAMHKISMLSEVLAVFAKKQLVFSILENNLLEAVRFWLEPLPDRSLPAYNIQRDLFNILSNMQIKTDYLRQSGLGKVVLFYSKDVRPEANIRRQAEKLVREWSRPILGKSDNYRHRLMKTQEYDPRALQARRFAGARPSASAGNGLEPPQIKQGRTRMPDSTPSTYDIVPVSQINPDDQRTNRPVGASAEDAMRRMKARLASGGPKKGKKGGLSIEGRGLH